MRSIQENKRIKGFLDLDNCNFFFLTIPLSDDFAANFHVFLPKIADNSEEFHD